MKCIVKFHESCLRVITEEKRSDRKISMAMIESSFGKDILYELTQMKFKIPTIPEQEMRKYFDDFYDKIEQKFTDLEIWGKDVRNLIYVWRKRDSKSIQI